MKDLSSVICEIAAVQAQPFQTATSADPGPTTTPAGGSACEGPCERARLVNIIREYADHQSVRCGWPARYGKWKDGDCACGLVEDLRKAGLPTEWAGGPPE